MQETATAKKEVLALVHSWVGKQIGSLSQQDISTRGIGGALTAPHSTSTFLILSLIIPKADYMAGSTQCSKTYVNFEPNMYKKCKDMV